MARSDARSSAAGSSEEVVLEITRVFDAPRAEVFDAWTDPRHLAHWWGPKGFTNPRCEVDVRPGGAIRIDMRGPDGTVYPMEGVFHEITRPEKLVFTSAALDIKGTYIFDNLNIVTFADHGDGKTLLTLQVRVVNATADAERYLKDMEQGWTETLDRLETSLDLSGREIVIRNQAPSQ